MCLCTQTIRSPWCGKSGCTREDWLSSISANQNKKLEVVGTQANQVVETYFAVTAPSLVNQVFNACDLINNQRTSHDILAHLMTEVGELAQEVIIDAGHSYKTAGLDGVVGESIDIIICALDMIRQHRPELSEQDIMKLCGIKLSKWINTAPDKMSGQ